MGGRVGLKGTDGVAEKAIQMGAKPIAEKRAKETLSVLKRLKNILFLTASGKMGENLLQENFSSDSFKVVCYAGEETSSQDTKNICREFSKRKVDLVLFGGGDGTAQDVYQVIKKSIPMLGIPCGVKMFSSVFGVNPRVTGKVAKKFLKEEIRTKEGEIMKVDEKKFRSGIMDARRVGYVKVPHANVLMQERKMTFHSSSDEEAKKEIAQYALEFMEDNTLYILGPGSTMEEITHTLGTRGTLVGVDAVKNQNIIGRDLNEQQLLKILQKERRAKILVSPLGAQGFIFGRGNQQISPEVIKKVGVKNVIILATPLKLSQTPYFLVDTGDRRLDKQLSGSKAVISGHKEARRKRVEYLS